MVVWQRKRFYLHLFGICVIWTSINSHVVLVSSVSTPDICCESLFVGLLVVPKGGILQRLDHVNKLV